jgi:uncharacterized protein YyaL (SSP411 family)
MSSDNGNSLEKAASAYLRSAMHQPIHWFEWGEAAFAAAKSANKPMLLDIGAVWCHWCHVMDRESYEDAEVATIVNENFIAVKVDRDERPDIDSRYQLAVSALSGQGGWPLTAFLTPEGKPFYGGTYFPPNDNYGRPSFKRVLKAIAAAYHEKSSEVAEQALQVVAAIGRSEAFAPEKFSPRAIDAIVESAIEAFDEQNGGFGRTPKFPHPAVLDLLLDHSLRANHARAREVFTHTLEQMARGGVYDQLAGGFHRYSVDEHWIVPHFEKMCYDNSELLKNYAHASLTTGNAFFAEVARDIVRWMDEWLSDRERGGFYASQDADYSLDDDGDYFTWTREEARAVLTEEESEVACLHYDINEVGEMHHNPAKNVLFQRAPLEEVARRMNLPAERVREVLAAAKQKMYAARLQRPTPYVDKSLYVGWNGLCISAYLEAAAALDLEWARKFALRSLDRVLAEGWMAGSLRHVIAYSDPKAEMRKVSGVLDDYAFTATACLDAYEASGELRYFEAARAIADAMIAKFYDTASGGFFDSETGTGEALGVLGTRRKPFQDSPTPAGNAAAAGMLCRLHTYTGEVSYHEKAKQTLELIMGVAAQYGIFAGTYALAAVRLAYPHTQVVIAGDGAEANQLRAAAQRPYAVNKSVLRLGRGDAMNANRLPPALAQTLPGLPGLADGSPAIAVVCSGFACQPPTSDPDELRRLIAEAVGS